VSSDHNLFSNVRTLQIIK